MEGLGTSVMPRLGEGRAAGGPQAFSLVEVVLALGIISFCLVAILGLIPTGLNVQKSTTEEASAASALSMVASVVRSAHFTSASSGNATYRFSAVLSDSVDPESHPTEFWVTQSPWSRVFFLKEDGMIRKSGDTASKVRQVLFIEVTPPMNRMEPVKVYAAVSWPSLPSDTATMSLDQLKGRQGFSDALITYALPR
jgi:type II secretory pathway pseudopilin PulG